MDIVFTLEQVLNGGYHANIGVSVDGGPKQILFLNVEDLRAARTLKERREAAIAIISAHLDGAATKAEAAQRFPFTVTL